jgi:hypothetical protein
MKSDLQEFLEDYNFECRSYSGRGMYGRECLGVVVDTMTEMFGLVYDAGAQGVPLGTYSMHWDSMGTSTIFYWPGVEFVEDEDDFEDEEDEGE